MQIPSGWSSVENSRQNEKLNTMSEKELSLVELLTVEPTGAPDEFTGPVESYGPLGIYGGHFIGQALAAGLATVEAPKVAHSLHCYFLNPGDPEVVIEYNVDRLREGRSSDVRSIHGSQNGQGVFQMLASFKIPEDGDEHQPQMPAVDDADLLYQAALDSDSAFTPPPTQKGRVDFVLASEHFMQPEFVPGREPALKVWMRCNSAEGIDEREAQTVLAFLSDSTLLFNSVIPHGVPFRTHRLTSIDHAVWFHRSCDVGAWLLYDQLSSAAVDGRGMNEGRLFDRRGALILTAVQESMLRKVR